jgi:hypothetical protein
MHHCAPHAAYRVVARSARARMQHAKGCVPPSNHTRRKRAAGRLRAADYHGQRSVQHAVEMESRSGVANKDAIYRGLRGRQAVGGGWRRCAPFGRRRRSPPSATLAAIRPPPGTITPCNAADKMERDVQPGSWRTTVRPPCYVGDSEARGQRARADANRSSAAGVREARLPGSMRHDIACMRPGMTGVREGRR